MARDALVNYALENSSNREFRKLLAPEMRHAIASTASSPENDNSPGSFPILMRTEANKLYHAYSQAHEDMKESVANCNTALGYPERQRLSLKELDQLFADETTRQANTNAYDSFQKARAELFTPHEQALQAYCESEQTYCDYITLYYARNNWVAFQRQLQGERSTSIVDIAARMLKAQIIIYQKNQASYQEIYRTAAYGSTIKHIEFFGNNHFYQLVAANSLVENNNLLASQEDTPSVTKELLTSRGLAGYLYQVKILMLYALNAYYQKQPFYLYTEASQFAKFDDVVLFLNDTMQVMQVKHSFNPDGRYVLKDMTDHTDGKKAVLTKYFDSWLMIENLRRQQPEHYREKIKYLFITNHGLNNEDGLQGLYDQTTERFSEKLLSGPLDSPKQEQARQAIMRTFYQHLQTIQNDIKESCKALVILFKKNKNKTGKAKGSIILITDEVTKHGKLLLGLLLQHGCIKEIQREKYRGNPFYQLTQKFIAGDEELPPIIVYLRTLLSPPGNFIEDFSFSSSGKNFANLSHAKPNSFLETTLCTGYLGPLQHQDSILSEDFSNIDELISQPALPVVSDFFQQFQFKIAQPNEAEMTAELQAKLGVELNVIDRGFYFYFYEAMLEFLLSSSNEPLTEEKIAQVLSTAKTAIERNKLIGHSARYQYYLRHDYDLDLIISASSLLTDFIENNETIMIAHGKSEWLLAMTICHELEQLKDKRLLKEDDHGFIDASFGVLPLDHTIFNVDGFRLLVINHAEKLNDEQLQHFANYACQTGKKLLLLTQEEVSLQQRLASFSLRLQEVPLLQDNEIESNIQQKNCSNKGIMLGKRFISFTSMMQNRCSVIRDPFHLSSMLQQAIPEPPTITSNNTFFVKPTLARKIPVYRLATILHIKYPLIWLDQADLSEHKQILSLDLVKLKNSQQSLAQIINEETTGEPFFTIVLQLVNTEQWSSLPNELKKDLADFPRLLIAAEEIPEDLIKKPLRLLRLSDHTYKLADDSMFSIMPSSDDYDETAPFLYHPDLTIKKTNYRWCQVMLADYGSGKTCLTETLLNEPTTPFNWIIRIPLKTLRKDMHDWSLLQLAQAYLDMDFLEEWQNALLNDDLENGNVLWLLDGFDEMLPEQRNELNTLIVTLLNQKYCLLTSRPSAANFISVQPNVYLTIKPFDHEQIQQFIVGFFADDQTLQKTACELISHWQTNNRLQLLGKPLMCRIACEIIANTDSDLAKLNDVTLATLFDAFIQANFRKYHHDHNRTEQSRLKRKRLGHLSSEMVTRLKQVAYAKLFPNAAHYSLIADEVLDLDLQQFGLITNITKIPATLASHYHFDHQTQIEYFAALYWVEQLLTISQHEQANYLNNHWANELYNAELQVVWQFVAGIVTAESQPAFLKGDPLNALMAFCDFLLEPKKDLVGKSYRNLLLACYKNMNQACLKKYGYDVRLEKLLKELSEKAEQTQHEIIKTHSSRIKKNLSAEDAIDCYSYKSLYTIEDYQYDSSSAVMLNEIKGSLKKKTILNNLKLIKKYCLSQTIEAKLIADIRDNLLQIYAAGKDNDDDYRKAYALLSFMIDQKLITLQDCVKSFTKNFDQKNCVLDVVYRLNQASLLTDEHITTLFKIGRARFWDFNAGLPVILLLKDRFCEAIAELLKYNLLERVQGDFEITLAINVLLELIQEDYQGEQFSCLMDLIIEIYNVETESITDKEKKKIIYSFVNYQDPIAILYHFQQRFALLTLANSKALRGLSSLLYHYCFHYDSALMIEDNKIMIKGQIQGEIVLPNIALFQEAVTEQMQLFGSGPNTNSNDNHLTAINKLEICESYYLFLQDNSTIISSEKELAVIAKLTHQLPAPPQPLTFVLSKGGFVNPIAIAHTFGQSLKSVDDYLAKKLAETEGLSFWDCDAGIPSTAYLGNDFGKGAYDYLCYCYKNWHFCQSYVRDALIKFLYRNKLTNNSALIFFLRSALIVSQEQSYNFFRESFHKELINKLKELPEQFLLKAFVHLLQDNTLTAHERQNLNALKEPWQDAIQKQLVEGINLANLNIKTHRKRRHSH